MSNFAFLQSEFPDQYNAAIKTEAAAHSDPRTACFYARRTLELAMNWLFKHDPALKLPYQDNLSALVHEPTFKQTAGEAVFNKARVIVTLGNRAVHSHRPIPGNDALVAVRELFHFSYWLARTYGRSERPAPGLAFDPAALPKPTAIPQQTAEQLAQEAGWMLDQPRDREFEVAGMPNNQGKGYVDYVLWGDDGKPLALVEAKRTRRDPRVGQQQAKLYADCVERQFGQRPVIFYSNGYEHWLWDDVNHPPRQVQGFYTKTELELLVQRRRTRKPLAEATIDGTMVERHYQKRAIRRIAGPSNATASGRRCW